MNSAPLPVQLTPVLLFRGGGGCEARASVWARAFRLFGCLIAAICVAGELEAANRWETLEAIHAVENPTNSSRPGRFGELGAYQFRAATWKMHTSRPFSEATNRSSSDEVAVLHYEWLKATLTRAGVAATSYNIALAWNAGADAVIKGRVSSASRDYATRVNNVATTLNANSQVASK